MRIVHPPFRRVGTAAKPVVLFTNGSNGNGSGAGRTAEEYAAYKEEQKAAMTEEQFALMTAMEGGIDFEKRKNKDVPDGTITTQPYFNDLLIPVALK